MTYTKTFYFIIDNVDLLNNELWNFKDKDELKTFLDELSWQDLEKFCTEAEIISELRRTKNDAR